MKQHFYKVFSVSLALLILASTLSFTVEKHFCGDVLIDVSVFTNVKSCGMISEGFVMPKPCCKDEVVVVKGQDKLLKASLELVTFQKFVAYCKAQVFPINYFTRYVEKQVATNTHAPPELVYDINIHHQVFLI